VLTKFTAEASASEKLYELQFLQHIRDHNHRHHGHSRVMQLLDNFYHSGPHGSHLCIASEVLGESVQWLSTKYERNILPIPIIKQIARQVLWGLDYLHSCNIIHTGMILPEDKIITINRPLNRSQSRQLSFENWWRGGCDWIWTKSTSIADFCTSISGRKSLNNLRRIAALAHRRRELPLQFAQCESEDQWSWCWSVIFFFSFITLYFNQSSSDRLVLLFLACWADKVSEHIADLIQSPALCAPEVEIGAGWDKSCDTWSMGCNVCSAPSSGLHGWIVYVCPRTHRFTGC
jgi:serine/threonine-protein kinase SRPK3